MIIAAADGSALGNPGPAGWAWYVDDDCWASGGWQHGTNNMGELMSVLDLLQQTAHLDEPMTVYCDSTYAINTITKWMAGWKRRGWKKGDGKPVMNIELVKALDEAMQGRDVTFRWVKGHAGHELNEAADVRANAAARAFQQGKDPDAGPGFSGATTNPPAAAVGQRSADQLWEEPDLFSDLEPEASDEEVVIALERSLLTDAVRSDPAEVAALLHPQWEEVGASGRLWTRDELLAEIAPLAEETTLDTLSVERLAPDTILLVWRAVTDGGATLRSSLWLRTGNTWRQRFHQGTPEA